MKKLFLILLFPILKLSAQGSGLTQDEILGGLNTITTAVPFLRISPDARAGGMGDGSIALSNDANAMYWNVSRLAFNKQKYGFSATYVPWLRALVPDIDLAYISAYYKPDSISAIGVSARSFTMGNQFITPSSVITGNIYRPYEFAVDGGYSRKLSATISAGVSFRYIQSYLLPSNVGVKTGRAFAGDLGLTWVSRTISHGVCSGNIQGGLAITNVGSKITYDTSANPRMNFIPTNLGLAFGSEFNLKEKHFFAIQMEVNKLLLPTPPVYARDANGNFIPNGNGGYQILYGKDPNRSVWEGMTGSFNDAPGGMKEEFREIMWSGGFEYDYKRIAKARFGGFYEHGLKGNRKYLTFGVGARYRNFALDVSYLLPVNTQRSPLQNTFRFTLLVHFNKLKK